jgi:RNA polymerase sigma-70 factor (ECF subfamily)
VKLKPVELPTAPEVSSDAILAIVPVLRAYAVKRLHSTSRADDAVQDTVERAWRARTSFIPGAELKPWIFTILRNAITDLYRRDSWQLQDVDGLAASRLVTQPDQLWRLHYADAVTAIETLNTDQRRAILLVVLGVTNEDGALAMNCPLGTFKGYVRLGRKKLRAAGIRGGRVCLDRAVRFLSGIPAVGALPILAWHAGRA